jgi:hypothetical protein
MLAPTIHVNGTSADRLISAVCDAGSAIDDAMAKLREVAPNARDYYPQGANAIQTAQGEYLDMLAKLNAVRSELQDLALKIDRQR